MAFVSHHEELPGELILKRLETLGAQIGQYLERKRTEADRARVLDLLESSLESSPDAILVTNAFGVAVHANSRWMTLWGVPPGTNLGDWRELVVAQFALEAAGIEEWNRLALEPAEQKRMLCPLLDGRTIEVITAPHLHAGSIVGQIWTFRDITALLKVEREREHLLGILNATLEATDDGLLVTSLSRKIT